jgi:hypothetical protein
MALEALGMIKRMDSTKLCPKCGAYWKCDCVIDVPPPVQRSSLSTRDARAEPSGLVAAQHSVCQHDWAEVVGVELDEDAVVGEAQVLVCRHCGLYAVEKSA